MAVTITETKLAEALGVNQALADRLLPVAVALVERYAPAAPEAIHNEAAIRCAGWLADTPAPSLQSEQYGDLGATWAPGQLSALRHSGAMALLSPFKPRRAGAI